MSYRIYGSEEAPMLMVDVNGCHAFGMTLNAVDPKSREWLAQHLSDAFQREIDSAFKRGVEQHKSDMRALLGIMEQR